MTTRVTPPESIDDIDDLLLRATELLITRRIEGRRLQPSETRLVTMATKVLVERAKRMVVQNQATIAALAAEIQMSFKGAALPDRERPSGQETVKPSAKFSPSMLPPATAGDPSPVTLVAGYGQLGESCRGILTREGQRWPADPAAWICTHPHPGPDSAEECAGAELDRRQSLTRASETSDKRRTR
jgi:hypothetical protein